MEPQPPVPEGVPPLALFQSWLAEAQKLEVNDPEAMCLSSVNAAGQPSSRMVLLRGCDAAGFVFYTNKESRKGTELLQQKHAALLFHWKSLRRQVRIEGMVAEVSAAESDAYFASRPRGSQLGAWASAQSRPLGSRAQFEAELVEITAKYEGQTVPRPPHWGGFRLIPVQIEFWQEQPFRLHDRVVYTRSSPTSEWTHDRLYP